MIFLIILLIIICVALGLFVLIQNPKGGGLQPVVPVEAICSVFNAQEMFWKKVPGYS